MSANGVSIEDVPERSRYEATIEGGPAGFLEYRRRPDRITLIHTEVDPALEGRGVGSAIARFALEDARANGLRVRVACPFVTAWLRRHHEYDDIVALGGPDDVG
ncbi:MAG TPA: GNAT family N-acetyltransferase [Candidatus Limnocylindrales bacterium]